MILEKIFLYVVFPLLYPLVNFVVPIFSRNLRERRKFERKNMTDPAARSFKLTGQKADIAFEVSSVGELEHVLPIINHALDRQKKVEIIYCSKSVEGKCLSLFEKYPLNLRVMRLPLVTFCPFKHFHNVSSWLTAKTLVLCRYDFFPQLLVYGARKDVSFVLVSATLKNKKILWDKKRIYSLFDVIICATEHDQRMIEGVLGEKGRNIRISTYDFRIPQIASRLIHVNETLAKHKSLDQLFNLKGFFREKAIIFGSFWAVEAEVFANEDFLREIWEGGITVVLAPHELNKENLSLIKRRCEHFSGGRLKVYTLGPDDKNALDGFESNPGPIMLTHKGILCELYSRFKFAFVGGGHGRSIHSVLEPYLASSIVFCGPKIHRSTEFDFITDKSPAFVRVVENLRKFFPAVKGYYDRKEDVEFRKELMSEGQKHVADFFKILGNGVIENVE